MADQSPEPPSDARAAKQAARVFMSAVTHELRTPLNGVLGMAGLLEGTDLKPDQREYVAAIRESGEHLLTLIDDILDVSKLEAEGVALETATFSPARLVQSVVELMAPKAWDKGLELASVIDPRIPDEVEADPGRLRQVLLNVVGNAIKFTNSGGAIIRLSAVQDGQRRTVLDISVADTGPGIDESLGNKAFEPFVQGPGDGEARGAGLGLAIARRLIEAMDGSVTLESGLGGGAVARLRAPVAGAVRRHVFDPLRTGKLVIAAKSSIVREAMCEQARLLGAAAEGAVTMKEARRAITADDSAVLLIDAGWAGEEDALPRAAARSVLLLAPGQRDQIDELKKRGFNAYLMKPARHGSLAAVLRGEESPDIPEERPVAANTNGRARILLAEDNEINALLARTILTEAGYMVDQVGDGAEAVSAAGQTRYDLILMDMRMPKLDGIDAAKQIRAKGAPWDATPIIALTANGDAEDREACLAAGMDDFFTKPVERKRLTALAARWTGEAKQAKVG